MDNLSNPLNLLASNMCSPMVIYIVFVVVTGIALFMTRSSLKRYNTEKMDTLFNIHLMNEIKMVIVMGTIIYGLCQYNQVNLAWIFLIFPIIYVLLKNILIFIPVSSANQNAPVPKNFNQEQMMKQIQQDNLQQKIIQQQQEPQMERKGIMETPINKDIGGLGGGLSPPLNSGLSGNDPMMNGNMMGF